MLDRVDPSPLHTHEPCGCCCWMARAAGRTRVTASAHAARLVGRLVPVGRRPRGSASARG